VDSRIEQFVMQLSVVPVLLWRRGVVVFVSHDAMIARLTGEDDERAIVAFILMRSTNGQ
jgi:hypothetical protein